MRRAQQPTSSDQKVGQESCHRRYKNVSALANRTAEIWRVQEQTCHGTVYPLRAATIANISASIFLLLHCLGAPELPIGKEDLY
jgi:hypothetical protein